MKIAIVEDLQEDCLRLTSLISEFFSDKRIKIELDSYQSAELFLESWAPGIYDIVFLDVYMTGMTGMDAATRLREGGDRCQLLFTTSSTDFAVQSYQVKATYYLLKPVEKQLLDEALTICLSNLESRAKSIEVLCNRVDVNIPLDNILYATTYHNAVHIYTTAGLFKSYITFETFFTLLDDDPRFLTCYKGCIVNMDHIISMEGNDFVFPDQTRIQIRKRGNSSIKKQYTQYLFSKAGC